MTTNGVRDFPSIPDTLPPKKRNSRENLNQVPTEPVFKTPSVFWNQSSFKRTRRSRELGSGSFLDLHSASTYYSQWPDVHQTFPHPVWDGRSYPSLAQRVANTVPLSNLNRNYPIMVHGFYQPSWGYVGAESRDVYDKSYGSIHNRQESKVIKPVPVYTTEAAKGEMGRLFGGESLANLSKESGINQDSGPSMEHRDIPRTVYDSKCYDLLQTCTNRTENLQQQNQTSTIRQQFKRSERMKGNYRPLVVSKGSAETQQLESGIFSLQVLSRFVEGSLIELEGGRLKRVENLEMKDFECCTESCQEFRLKKFCVQKISGSGTPGCVCLEVELEDEHSQVHHATLAIKQVPLDSFCV